MSSYILIFILCIIGLYINTRTTSPRIQKITEISTLILLIIFSGTRYNIGGSDYFIYKDVFEAVPNLSNFTWNSIPGTFGMENGYLLLNSIIKTLGFTYYGFTIIISTIFYSIFYISLKPYFKNFSFVLIIFLYKILFFNTFTSLRQSLSICIFLFSIKYIINKKFTKYAVAIIIASFIHASSLFLFPVYFLNYIKLNKKRYIAINLTYALIFVFTYLGLFNTNPISILNIIFQNNQILLQKTGSYFINSRSINLLNVIEYFSVSALLMFKYNNIDTRSREVSLVIKLFLVMGLLLTVFSNYEVIIRMRDYFVIFYAYILVLIVNATKSIKSKITIVTISLLISFFGYVRIINTFDGGALMPYRTTILEKVRYRYMK